MVRNDQIPDDFLKHKIKCSLFADVEWESVRLMAASVWHGAQLEQHCVHLSSMGIYRIYTRNIYGRVGLAWVCFQ